MQGHCLCGAIQLVIPQVTEVSACHCGMCRRWGGGPLLCVHVRSGVQISGSEKITTYRSSDWAERAFCSGCGTHLYYRLVSSDEYYLPAGLFQDATELTFNEQIFIDKKPGYYEFANRTHYMTEAEVFANFAPPQ